MIGTTDKRFEADPDEARCDADELTYLLGEVNALIPEAGLTPDSVLFTYSGVRPLPYAPDVEEWMVPRSHVLHDHAPDLPGLITVVGGKLTTYRQLAEEAVDDAFVRLGRPAPKCETKSLPLPGAVGDEAQARAALLARGVSELTADRLVTRYGTRAEFVVREADGDPAWLEVLHEPTGVLAAEMLVAVRREFALTLTDVLARRLLLAFEPDHGLPVAGRAAELLGAELGWDAARQAEEVAEYREWVNRLAVPEPVGSR